MTAAVEDANSFIRQQLSSANVFGWCHACSYLRPESQPSTNTQFFASTTNLHSAMLASLSLPLEYLIPYASSKS